MYLPKNQTSFDKLDLIPSFKISDTFKYQAIVTCVCNETVPSHIEWKIYEVGLQKMPSSQASLKAVLNPLVINETIPSYNSLLLIVPSRFLHSGLHKLVFSFEVQ